MNDKFKLFITLILLGTVYYPVYPEWLDALLNNSNNSHGLLVPFVVLYLIWERRLDLENVGTSPSGWGLLALVICLAIYLLALAGDVAVMTRVMMVFSLVSLMLYRYGVQFLKILIFPLLFLLFMVPVPVSVTGVVALPLQLFATKVSAGLIQAFSIPVIREGNMLYFVQTQLEVAEACSGIRSIIALTMISVLFVYFSPKGNLQKVILLISAIPVALLANILRVTGTGVLAHYFGNSVAEGFLHEFSGMAVFVFGLVILFLEFMVLNRLINGRPVS